MQVRTDFDGGALGTVLEQTPHRLVVELYRERAEDGINTQATWYYARFDHTDERLFTVELHGLHDVYDGRPSHSIDERDRPVISHDGKRWERCLDTHFDRERGILTIPIVPEGETVWLAHLEPYVGADLQRLHDDVKDHPAFRAEVAGESVDGAPIPLWTVGDDDSPHAVWLMARQHAWETHTSFCMEGIVRWLVSEEAEALRRRCCVKLLPWMDPDGVKRGGTRVNAKGFDTNRHWNQTDPHIAQHRAYRPEICAAKEAIGEWVESGRPVDLFVNFHDTQHDIFVTPAGCADEPALLGLYRRMSKGRFSGEHRVGGDGGGSVQAALHAEFGFPAALVELGTIHLPTYNRFPTAADRVDFGADFGRALAAVIPEA